MFGRALIKRSGLLALLALSLNLSAQRGAKVAAPFLLVAPDSRSSGMGDAAVASSPDVYAINSNPARYAFAENAAGIGLTFTPLQRKLIKDHNLVFMSGFCRLNDRETIAAGFKYHAMGEVRFADAIGNSAGIYNPMEFSFDFAYVRKLFDSFSIATSVEYIHTDLKAMDIGRSDADAASGIATGVGLFYTVGTTNKFSVGTNLKHLGPRMFYGSEKLPLPAMLSAGAAYSFIDEGKATLLFTAEVSKSLSVEEAGGTGFSTGVEYALERWFSLSGGFHGEKYGRYLSCGLSARIKNMSVGFSYSFDTSGYAALGNTSRFGLGYSFR